MRKVKRFAAIVLTAALLSPATAYAGNVEDAKALYEQVTEKQKSITDMNAYYDYQSHVSGSALEGIEDAGNIRMEMNVRIDVYKRQLLWNEQGTYSFFFTDRRADDPYGCCVAAGHISGKKW